MTRAWKGRTRRGRTRRGRTAASTTAAALDRWPALRLLGVLAVLLLLAAACAPQGDGERPERIIRMDMFDGGFQPVELTISSPEAVLFVFRNRGTVPHEFFLGDDITQARYEEALQRGEKRPSFTVVVAPGRTGEFSYYFGVPGMVTIACHMPGQFQSGMRLRVTVT